MEGLTILFLALLTGGSYAELDLAGRIQSLLAAQMGDIEHLAVRVETRSPAQEIVGDIDEVVVELTGFDAAKLPIKALMPQPKEHILKGRVKRLLLDGRKAQVKDLTFSRLALEVTDLRLDLVGVLVNKQVRLTDYGGSRVEARMTEDDLLGFVNDKLAIADEVSVDFQPGRAVATAKLAVGLLELNLTLTSGIKVVDGHRVELDQPQIESAGMALPEQLAERALSSINPLLDLHDLLDEDSPLILDRAEVTDSEIVLHGHLDFGDGQAGADREEHYAVVHRRLRREREREREDIWR